MKKASSIFLRNEICPRDVEAMIGWMDNPKVTKYLNEDPALKYALKDLLRNVPAPLLTFRFNGFGKFFIVCLNKNQAIGFVKLKEIECGIYEIVYVIGDESLWGHGYGESALSSALTTAFCTLRAKKVVAKIYPENSRSIRAALSCGFICRRPEGRLHLYSIRADEFFERSTSLHKLENHPVP